MPLASADNHTRVHKPIQGHRHTHGIANKKKKIKSETVQSWLSAHFSVLTKA